MIQVMSAWQLQDRGARRSAPQVFHPASLTLTLKVAQRKTGQKLHRRSNQEFSHAASLPSVPTGQGCLAVWPCCVRGHDMSAINLGLQKSCGGRAGGCGVAGSTCTGGERPPVFWLVSGIWLVSDDEPPAGKTTGWRTVVVVR